MYIQSKEPFTLLQKWQLNWCVKQEIYYNSKKYPPKNCKKLLLFEFFTLKQYSKKKKYQETNRFCDIEKLRHFFAPLPIVQEN